MTSNFAAALAARTIRETVANDDTAHRAHKAYVAATVAYAKEEGITVTEAARRVSAAYRNR